MPVKKKSAAGRTRRRCPADSDFAAILDYAPTPLWLLDLSGIKTRLETLKRTGPENLREYLEANRKELSSLVRSVVVLFVNRAAVKLFRASSRKELSGSLLKVKPPEASEAVVESIVRISRGEKSFAAETLGRTLNGMRLHIDLGWSVVPGNETDYARVLVRCSDITQLKITQEKLLASEKLFKAFMENLPAAAWIKDKNSRLVFTNRYYTRNVAGGKNLIGKRDTSVYPGDTGKRIRHIDAEVKKSGKAVQMDFAAKMPGGKGAYYSLTKFPVSSSDGSLSMGGIAFDITDRIELESRLEESREMYRELAETIREVVFSLSEDGFVTYISPFSSEAFGVRTDRIKGVHYSSLVHPGDLRSVDASLSKVARGKSVSFECRFIVESGDTRWGTVHLKPVYRNKRFSGIDGVLMGITKRKQAEVRERELNEQLRAINSKLQTAREEERASVAREIHDELGQKLTRLKIGLTIVRNRFDAAMIPRSLARYVDELGRSIVLVDDLMNDVRRIATELRPEELDALGLADSIRRYADNIRKETGLKCRFHLSRRRINLDDRKSSALFRIFQEALTNVVRHSGATEVEVHLSRYGERVRLEIADNGSGFK